MSHRLCLARASRSNQCTAVEALQCLCQGQGAALSEGGDDDGGGRAQVLIVIEESVGQLLDVAGAELIVSGHCSLGACQYRLFFYHQKQSNYSYICNIFTHKMTVA